jgi:hypothetical protein
VFPAHSRDDEVSSTSSEKYERDVTILNHCFDDIEKFIARLQHAAAASRELERRRRLVVFTYLIFSNTPRTLLRKKGLLAYRHVDIAVFQCMTICLLSWHTQVKASV